jgi:hypothetical protein
MFMRGKSLRPLWDGNIAIIEGDGIHGTFNGGSHVEMFTQSTDIERGM